MASAVSLEYLKSIQGAPGGIPTLDDKGEIPIGQLPPGAVSPFKGLFATQADLLSAYPTAEMADYAYVTATNSFWYWNQGLTPPAWTNQNITEADYLPLSIEAKAMVPYIIVPAP